MATPSDVLRKAAGEIGYYAPADPAPGSKYGRWEAEKLGQPWLAGPSTSIWWCVIFGSWVYDGLATVPGLPGYNTDHTLSVARAAGAVIANPRDAQPGDAVIYDWDKSTPTTNHFGIVELNLGATGIQAIEGNTSGSANGKQSNGNGVWRRTRPWSVVAAIIRPTYLNAPVAPQPHYANITAFQSAIRTTPDNVWGNDTQKHWNAILSASRYGGVKFPYGVAFAQACVGTAQDNVWGQHSMAAHDATVAAIQRAVGASVDEIVGPETVGKVSQLHSASLHTV